jgi:hypothetical protein
MVVGIKLEIFKKQILYRIIKILIKQLTINTQHQTVIIIVKIVYTTPFYLSELFTHFTENLHWHEQRSLKEGYTRLKFAVKNQAD